MGKIRLDLQTTSINEIVASMVELRLVQLPRGYSIECALNPDCGDVVCDPSRIGQVIMNLIDNAVKFSPDGGPIRIHTEAHGDEVRISVSDEGIGISPDLHESIFDRFEQIEGGLRRKTGGLGIGLSLVKQLLSLHGGRIWVESEVGKGSTFIFAVPLSPEQKTDSRETGRAAPAQDRSDSPWSGRKVLVVDDLADYHQLIKMLMRSAGQIQSAFNGQETLDALGRDRPDFIIMDLRMPVMDGFEAISRIKQNPETKDIPILGVSAQTMAEDREKCLQAGADGFVTKPIEYETLRREVRTILS